MRIVFAGTPDVAVPALRALAAEHEILTVLTRPDAPRGRSKRLYPSAVALAATELGLPVLKTNTLKTPEVQQQLRALQPDLAAVVAYGAFVPRTLLADFPWVNLHFSLLPRWRGAAPVQHAIAAGDNTSGLTVFQIAPGMDDGDYYAMKSLPLSETASASQVLSEYSEIGAEFFAQTIAEIGSGNAVLHPQDTVGITKAPMLSVAGGQVNWTRSALEISRHIRAYTDNPGAWTKLADKRIKLRPLEIVADTSTLPEAVAQLAPAQLYVAKRAVYVGTGSGIVALGEVAPAGKNWMDAAAWGRGLHTHDHLMLELGE